MSHLQALKKAKSLHDIAAILGFQPKALSFIIYVRRDSEKYSSFEIPKRSGGFRTINAPFPPLKTLQRRLADLLQNCIAEINVERAPRAMLSHGFRRHHSIITNADVHRGRRYVFNIDLEGFFDAINFGRVRGFFIQNKHFELDASVATILAKIACHNNVLPQGSPCSPVISNLIGHIADVRLAQLARDVGCSYSRYADDLTFSTNKSGFPSDVAVFDKAHNWTPGAKLCSIIKRAGFSINSKKTRMQYSESRQVVTGLVVNAKVNTRAEYRRAARAMVHRLARTGAFDVSKGVDADGKVIAGPGSLEQLQGMLSFINSVAAGGKLAARVGSDNVALNAHETLYRRFLFFKDFYAPDRPTIVCEGKTDNVYIRAAIRRLATSYPALAATSASGVVSLKARIYRYTNTTDRLLNLSGGTGGLKDLIAGYGRECQGFDALGLVHPIIVLIDNDSGSSPIYNVIAQVTKATKPSGLDPFYHVGHNLYVVPTPLGAAGAPTTIEDFFEARVKAMKLGGKSFTLKIPLDPKTEYGKHLFAEHVVKKNEAIIDFSGFAPILDRLNAVLSVHATAVASK